MLIRATDFSLALCLLLILAPILLVLTVVGYIKFGSPFFVHPRVGRGQKEFHLIKFRSLPQNTPIKPTHELSSETASGYGNRLRVLKLDEIPQLINVLQGDMSLVGPRPCLTSQSELISERDKRGVFDVLPGITGLAQICEVDMSEPKKLARLDSTMIRAINYCVYLKIIVLTAIGRGQGDRLR